MSEGRYSDGRDSTVHRVQVRLSGAHMEIVGENGEHLAAWPLHEVRLIDEAGAGRPLRLACASAPDARLAVQDPELAAMLAARLAPAHRRDLKRRRLRAGLSALALAGLVAAAYLFYPVVVSNIVALVPTSLDERMGASAREQLVQLVAGLSDGPALCSRAQGMEALDDLTNRLAAGLDSPFAFKVSVVRLDMVNAIALPGGYILLFKGLIDAARSTEEIAGVLAHEMAHVIKRDPMQALVRAQGISILMQAISGGAWASIGETLIGFSYSREVEARADAVAAAVLETADVGTEGLASFFDRLAQQEKSLPQFLTYFSTHPRSEDRARLSRGRSVSGTPLPVGLFIRLKSICEG